jgi:taurine dioxygenase
MTSIMHSDGHDPAQGRATPGGAVIAPVTGRIGATVTGLDLHTDQPPLVRDALERALHEHGVLFVAHDGTAGDGEHLRLAEMFGNVSHYALGERTEEERAAFVTVLDNEALGNPAYGSDRWHTDGSALECPPQAASLRATVLPEVGGDTVWASMYAAYEALSSHYQRLLDGLEALHSVEAAYRARPIARENDILGGPRSAVHPVVIRDPITGKRALYVNSHYTERILGLTDHENESLLRMLFEHVNTPDFHVRHSWDTHTLVAWDERVTQHRAVNDFVGRRILRRITIDGVAPAA